MKSFDTELQKHAEKISLRASERREIRGRLLAYMEYHPLKKPERNHQELSQTILSQRFVTINFNTLYTKIASGVFALLFIVGIPLAAERSVPGDVLYLVKTGINEGLQAQFANSPYEKVAFETKLLERRIAEARLLASEGKLTEEVEAEIAQTVKNHANAAQDGLDELRAGNADEAAIAEITFGSALEVQSAVLDANQDPLSASPTDSILDVVKTAQEEAIAKKGTTTPSFEGLMARIESETTRAYELFESISGSATDEERASIDRRLSDIGRKIHGAERKQEGQIDGSIEDLTVALGLVHKLILFMTDIDVRTSVELETLVPIEMTDEERKIAAEGLLEEIIKLEEQILLKTPLISDAGLYSKVQEGNVELARLIEDATTTIESGSILEAEGVIANAYALAVDLDLLLAGIRLPEQPVEGEVLGEEIEFPLGEIPAEEEEVQDVSPEETIDEIGSSTDATTTNALGV